MHKGATKTVLLHSFLQSIGFPLSAASPTDEDNTGTTKLIRTNHHTDIVCHHTVQVSWLKDYYLNYNLNCNTKPDNDSQSFSKVSYFMFGVLVPLFYSFLNLVLSMLK